MKIRSFIIAYALVLAILLFADRRPAAHPDRYSHVVDLTDGQSASPHNATESAVKEFASRESTTESQTRIIAPAALIPGTWSAGQIPAERLIAPLVVMDLKAADTAVNGNPQISLDDISAWESQHGMIPQGAVVAIRQTSTTVTTATSSASTSSKTATQFPVARDAAMFLFEARYTIGFAVETAVTLSSDRTLAQQLALHGNYVVEGATRFTSLPATGSLVIVAPAKNKKPGEVPVRILAMVR